MKLNIDLSGQSDYVRQRVEDAVEELFIEHSMEGTEPDPDEVFELIYGIVEDGE